MLFDTVLTAYDQFFSRICVYVGKDDSRIV